MHDDMQPDNNMPMGQEDHEGAMAKADLYKLANYSFKLFKKIEPEQQLEGWVQAKITKAADYIASVYHYLEYEMKFNQYGQALDNSDVLSESQKAELKNKLMEAKSAMKELKKKQAEKLTGKKVSESKDKCTCEENESTCKVHSMEEGFEANAKVGDTFKTKTGVATKTKTGLKHTNTSHSDEEHGEPVSKVKQKSAAEKKADKEKEIKLPKHKGNTWGMKGGEKFGSKMEEGSKPDFLDMDKDGDKKEPMKKAVADKKKKVAEEKSSTGGEITRGKGFTRHSHNPDRFSDEPHGEEASKAKSKSAAEKAGDKAADKAEEKQGKAWEKRFGKGSVTRVKDGKKVDEAAKPSAGLSKEKKSEVVKKAKAGEDIGKPGKGFAKVEKAAKKGGAKDPKAVAAAAMWKNVKESVKIAEAEKKAKKDYDGDGKIESGKDEHAGSVDKAIKASKAKETVKESTDFSRMQEQLARLNRSESHVLKESSEADQIRQLSKRLLG